MTNKYSSYYSTYWLDQTKSEKVAFDSRNFKTKLSDKTSQVQRSDLLPTLSTVLNITFSNPFEWTF